MPGEVPAAVAVAVTAVLGAALLGGASHALTRGLGADRRWLLRLVGLTTVVRLAVALTIGSSPRLIDRFGGDAVDYHQMAMQITEYWHGREGFPDTIAGGKEGFYYALAGLYWVVGPHRIAALVFVVLLSVIVVPVTADTSRRLFGDRAFRPAALLVALLPGMVVWSSQLLREAPILLALALALNLAVRLTERLSLRSVLGLGATLVVLLTLRANVAVLVGAGLLAGLGLVLRPSARAVVLGAAAAAALAAAVLVTGVGHRGLGALSGLGLYDIEVVRQDLSRSDSGFARDADVSTVGGALRYLPVGLVNVAAGPFPWQATNARQTAGVLDAVLVWALLPSLWRGWWAAGRLVGRVRYVVALPALITLVGLALLLGNYGAVVRERLQVLVLLAPLIALGWGAPLPALRPVLGSGASGRRRRHQHRRRRGLRR